MIEENNKTGRNVVVRNLKPNKKLVGVSITYRDYGTYKLSIFGTTKSRVQLPDNDFSKVKQFEIHGVEAFYISNNGIEQMIWIEEDINGKALQYEITGKDITQELLIKIVEKMS